MAGRGVRGASRRLRSSAAGMCRPRTGRAWPTHPPWRRRLHTRQSRHRGSGFRPPDQPRSGPIQIGPDQGRSQVWNKTQVRIGIGSGSTSRLGRPVRINIRVGSESGSESGPDQHRGRVVRSGSTSGRSGSRSRSGQGHDPGQGWIGSRSGPDHASHHGCSFPAGGPLGQSGRIEANGRRWPQCST